MSRKDYVRSANVIANAQKEPSDLVTAREIADGLADVFAADNDKFDRKRFLRACGF